MKGQYSNEVQSILTKPTATVEEFRFVMGCGLSQAYQFVREGRIRTLRIGRKIFIPTSAIQALLEGEPEKVA